MLVSMAKSDAQKLAEFLEAEYMRRFNEYGRGYKLGQFAKDLGLSQPTLNKLMNAGKKTKATTAKGKERVVSLATLRALVKVFGAAILQDLDLWPG